MYRNGLLATARREERSVCVERIVKKLGDTGMAVDMVIRFAFKLDSDTDGLVVSARDALDLGLGSWGRVFVAFEFVSGACGVVLVALIGEFTTLLVFFAGFGLAFAARAIFALFDLLFILKRRH